MSWNWDIPKQSQLVENGQAGDCWRCCIAAILQVPAENVPHFLEEALRDRMSMDPLTQRWLNARGWCLIESKKFQFPRYYGDPFDGLPVIAAGPTERSMMHEKLVYDPHPSNAGLTAVTEEYLVVPIRGGKAA
jgi:hypothetical protein